MKLNVLSDLHLSSAPFEPPETDADVVVLAGDIARPAHAMRWASAIAKPVLYVAGNHEFYGSSLGETGTALELLCAGTHVRVLEKRELVIDGVRFLGTTLWTDFELAGADARPAAMTEASRLLRDFSRIAIGPTDPRPFTPADAVVLFQASARWLESRLAAPHDGPTVVITHHAPSPRSVHPRFAGSLLNACFVSDLERLLDGRRVQLWIHGHTHDSFDYCVNGTRVVCNPRGYSKAGAVENARFDPHLVVDTAGA